LFKAIFINSYQKTNIQLKPFIVHQYLYTHFFKREIVLITAIIHYSYRHQILNEIITIMPCENCNLVFVSQRKLNAHQEIHLTNRIKYVNNFSDESVSQRPYRCNICKKPHSDDKFIIKHLVDNECFLGWGRPGIECHLCPMVFAYSIHLKQHMVRSHPDQEPYACPVCGETFRLVEAYRRHVSCGHFEATSNTRVKCLICPRNFSLKDDFILHLSDTHNRMPLILCHICGAIFDNWEYFINNHLELHTRIRCSVCLIDFDTVELKNRHDDLIHRRITWEGESSDNPQ